MLAKYAPLLHLLQRAVTRPRYAWAYVSGYFGYRKTSSLYRRRINEYQSYLHTLEDGLSHITSGSKALVGELLRSPVLADLHLESQTLVGKDKGYIPLSWDGDLLLAQASYCVTRLLRPDIVVETGVAHGITTAFILQGLADNSKGHLYSIDLPALKPGAEAAIGIAVPERLRPRWTLILGDSRHALPKILRQAGHVDMFLHDSGHYYSLQTREYRLAWPYLRPGGVLLSDDLTTDAFIKFAEMQAVRPIVIAPLAKGSPFGILVKM